MKEFKPSDIDLMLKDNKTDYFETNSKVIPIEAASFKRLIKHLTSGVPVMMVSAFTGDDVVENNKNTKLLIRDIIRNKLSFIPVNGYWKENLNDEIKPEKSFFVVGKIRGTSDNVDYDEFFDLAVEFCNKYNQSAVLVGKADGDKLEYNYVDKNGNYTQYKKKQNGKFVLESVVSAKIDDEKLKNSKATMFADRMLYNKHKNYGLYYLGE